MAETDVGCDATHHVSEGLSMVSLSVRQALRGMDGPIGVIDRDALDANIDALRERAGGLPIRVASKSLRILGVMS